MRPPETDRSTAETAELYDKDERDDINDADVDDDDDAPAGNADEVVALLPMRDAKNESTS